MFIELTLIEISTKEIVKKQKMAINPAMIEYVIVFQGDEKTGHSAIYLPGDSQMIVDESYNTVRAKLGLT